MYKITVLPLATPLFVKLFTKVYHLSNIIENRKFLLYTVVVGKTDKARLKTISFSDGYASTTP